MSADVTTYWQARTTLVDLYRIQGDRHNAEQVLREVHEAQKQFFGSEHDQALVTERSLALALRHLGRIFKNEELLRETIKRCTKVLGMKHRIVSYISPLLLP
jgi:hypothetical protein